MAASCSLLTYLGLFSMCPTDHTLHDTLSYQGIVTSGCSRKGPFTFILFMYYNPWKAVTFPWDLLLTHSWQESWFFQTLPCSDLGKQLGTSSMKVPFMKNSGDMHILGCCGWARGRSQNTAALSQGDAPMSCLLLWILFPRFNVSHGKSL